LNEIPILMTHPKRQPPLPERRVWRVVIRTDQPFFCADRRHRQERTLHFGQIGCSSSELELDFRRNGNLPFLTGYLTVQTRS